MERALQPLPRQFSTRWEYTQCTDSQGAHEKYDHGKGTLRPWNLVLVSKILLTLLKTNIALENRSSLTFPNHHISGVFAVSFRGVYPKNWGRRSQVEEQIFQWVKLSDGFKYLYFHPYLGKIPNVTNICQMGWNHQLGWLKNRQLRKRFSRITRRFWRLLAIIMIPMRRRFIDSWWPITFYEDWIDGKQIIFFIDFEKTHRERWLYNRILPRMTLFSDQCSQHCICTYTYLLPLTGITSIHITYPNISWRLSLRPWFQRPLPLGENTGWIADLVDSLVGVVDDFEVPERCSFLKTVVFFQRSVQSPFWHDFCFKLFFQSSCANLSGPLLGWVEAGPKSLPFWKGFW